jgi:hypothetical protein
MGYGLKGAWGGEWRECERLGGRRSCARRNRSEAGREDWVCTERSMKG